MPDYVTRSVRALSTAVPFGRYVEALAVSRGDSLAARYYAERWKDSPQVERAFDYHIKAAVTPGTTTDATWALPLAQTGISADVISLLRGSSILGALEPKLRMVPFNVKVPRATAPLTIGGWLGEGAPTAVGKLAFDQVGPLPATKAGTIVAVTKDLLTVGTPTSQEIITRDVVGGLGAYLDQQLLLPTVAVSAANPAAITNGATAVTSTGTTAAQISADLAALRAAVTTPGAQLVWVMPPKTMATISAALGAANTGLPATLNAIPVIASSNSPAQVTLIDGAGVLLAADPNGIEVDLSQSASVQMNDAPDSPVTAATVMTSFFQANLVGIRAARYIHWLRVHAGAVSYMTVTY